MKKKFFAAFCSLAMMFSLTPQIVLAEEVETPEETNENAETEDVPAVIDETNDFLTDLQDDGYAELGAWKVEHIKDNIYHMDEETEALPGGATDEDGNMNNPSSIYFVVEEDELLVIDGGNPSTEGSQKEADAKTILESMAGDREVTIALTHGHGDHVGLLSTNITADINLKKIYVEEADATSSYFTPYTDITTYITDGDTFTIGGYTYEVVSLNAHTAGSCVYVQKDKEVVFTGDSIGSGFVWIFWQEGTNPLGTLSDGVSELQDIVKVMSSPTILAGHRWQQFWSENTSAPGEMTIQYLNDMAAVLTGLEDGTALKTEYTARGVEGDVEVSSGGKAKIDTTEALIQEYLDGVNEYDGAEGVYIFSESSTLSIETENNVNAAKFLIYMDETTTREEAEQFLIDSGIQEIISTSASTAIIINKQGDAYDEDDIEVFKDIVANRIGPTTNLNLVGFGEGATFINQELTKYCWGVAGIMTYGGEAGETPEYTVPVYISNSEDAVADAYIEVNGATSVTTEGTITTSVNPDDRFALVVENSAEETEVEAFKNAWETVLSKFGRIGNITYEEGGIGTWYLHNNLVEGEYMFFDSVDAIDNVTRYIYTEDLDGDGTDSLWYVYVPEQVAEAEDGTVPVVFLMHGNTNDPRTQWDTSGWANIASEEGVILVCPEWQGHTYQGYTYDAMTDDTNLTANSDFITCVNRVLEDYTQIDASRVYISGLSAGCRNTTYNALSNTGIFAAGAGQSGPFKQSDETYDILMGYATEKADTYDFPIIYFSGDKDEYLQDYSVLGDNGGYQLTQIFQTLNNMEVTTEANEEYADLYGIEWDTYGVVENEGLCTILGGTITNENGVEISMNRIYGWGHWNYAADAELMWDFMKKYARDTETGETIRLDLIDDDDDDDDTKTSYEVTEGADSKYNSGSSTGVTIKTNASGTPTAVLVDGAVLTTESYTVNSDGTVTIDPDYLDSLGTGTHTITIQYEDGTAETTITIEADDTTSTDKAENPQTGVDSGMWTYAGLLFVSLAVAAAAVYRLRRKSE